MCSYGRQKTSQTIHGIRRQFRTDFRVRRGHVLTWLYFLKANHPDYRYITISTDRIAALPVDSDVSSSVICITDDTLGLDGPVELTDMPPNSQSVVLSLDQDTTEANLILEGITGRKPPSRPPGTLNSAYPY